MATVAELKAQAESLGIKITSRMRKGEIEQAIAKFYGSDDSELNYTSEEFNSVVGSDDLAESDSNKINEADLTPTLTERELRALRAREAGSRGVSALPLSNAIRQAHYHGQNGYGQTFKETAAQGRRMRRKAHKMSARQSTIAVPGPIGQ